MRSYYKVLILIIAAGCSTQQPTPWIPIPAPDLGAMVAKVGETPIYAKQIEAIAAARAVSHQEALQTMIETNLLAAHALKVFPTIPVDKDVLVQRLLDRDFEPTLSPAGIPDEEIKVLYQRAINAYVRPRQIEIGLLAIYTGKQINAEGRAKRARTAREFEEYLRQKPPRSLTEFSAIAADPRWKDNHLVYTRFFQGPEKPLSSVVGSRVTQLKAEGEMTSMIEDEDGFFVARYIAERPALNVPYSTAEQELRKAYYEQWRPRHFLKFTDAMMRLRSIETFPGNLPNYRTGS